MPRQGRLDAPGVLHHVMVRGINGEKIFKDNRDYYGFLARLEKILKATETPAPLNLFMNIPWDPDGTLHWEEPLSKPGDTITFRAEMDIVAVFSACPMDLLPINGKDGIITDAHVRLGA